MRLAVDRFRRLKNYSSVDEHEDAVDIRGFKVITADNVVLGKVDALIADAETDEIRYIEVNTKDHLDSPLNAENKFRTDSKYSDRFEGGAHYMLVPAGLISIDRKNFEINVNGILVENIYTGPRHTKDYEFNPKYEYNVVDKYVKEKDSEFLEKYGAFHNTDEFKVDNHFYEKDYFRTRRGERGKPNSPVL